MVRLPAWVFGPLKRPLPRVDRFGEGIELPKGDPDLAAVHGAVLGRGDPAGVALAHERGVGEVVAVDGGVEDGAEQAEVGVDGGGLESLGDQAGLPGAD